MVVALATVPKAIPAAEDPVAKVSPVAEGEGSVAKAEVQADPAEDPAARAAAASGNISVRKKSADSASSGWTSSTPRLLNWRPRIEKQNAPFDEAVSLLAEIPGFDRTTAWSVIAEIGIDMNQFPSADHLASWAGVCPGNNESGGKRLSGKTRKGSRWLRQKLCQSAWCASRCKNSYFTAFFQRIAAPLSHSR